MGLQDLHITQYIIADYKLCRIISFEINVAFVAMVCSYGIVEMVL